MDGARSISSVLHHRLQQLALPELAGHDVTWTQRTPASAPAVAHELAAALDDRARALGEQLAVDPEPWLARQLGVLAPGASPALREEYARRAAAAAAYREAAGITDPDQAVVTPPAPPQPRTRRHAPGHHPRPGNTRRNRHHPRHDPRRARSPHPRGRTRPGQRPARRVPPAAAHRPGRSRRLAAIRRRRHPHDHTQAANAKALAGQLAAERQQLEAANARYEQWSAVTSSTRETAAKAKAELERRGLARKPGEPPQRQTVNEPEAGNAIELSTEREHQVAATTDEPQLPEQKPQPELTPQQRLRGRPGA